MIKSRYTLFDENIENHAVSLALLLIYIDFDRKVLKRSKIKQRIGKKNLVFIKNN
jgi:hypothetical protein